MKLSENTLSVLKNFSTINQNLLIKPGKTLSTMSAMKNIVATAKVEEDFKQQNEQFLAQEGGGTKERSTQAGDQKWRPANHHKKAKLPGMDARRTIYQGG